MKPIVFVSKFLMPLVKFLMLTKVQGRENLPINSDKPLIFCANHFSNWDPLVVSTSLQLPFRYIAKSTLFKAPVVKIFMKWFECIPVDRDSRDVVSLRSAINAAKEGQPVMIFPQGRRVIGEVPKCEDAKKGVALMIASTGAVVVPLGLYAKGYKAGIFKRFYVNIGKPITPETYRPIIDEGDKATRFDRLTDYVFGEVIKLSKPF